MGWFSKDDSSTDQSPRDSDSDDNRFCIVIRRKTSSKMSIPEMVEDGKFVRSIETTKEVTRYCLGNNGNWFIPSRQVRSTTEITKEEVTDTSLTSSHIEIVGIVSGNSSPKLKTKHN